MAKLLRGVEGLWTSVVDYEDTETSHCLAKTLQTAVQPALVSVNGNQQRPAHSSGNNLPGSPREANVRSPKTRQLNSKITLRAARGPRSGPQIAVQAAWRNLLNRFSRTPTLWFATALPNA